MRLAPLVLALALPLGAVAQPAHTVTDGVWGIVGTPGPDTADLRCTSGFAQLNGTDPLGGATLCTDVARIDVALFDGDDFATLRDLGLFDLDPGDPGTLDPGAGTDIVQLFLETFPGDLSVVGETTASAATPFAVRVATPSAPVFETVFPPSDLFVDVVTGDLDDRFAIDIEALHGIRLGVFAGGGDDEVDGTGSTVAMPVFLSLGGGDDLLDAGPLDTRLAWAPGDGTDRHVGGPGRNDLEIFGGDLRLGIHQIKGFLSSECAFFDFLNGGGVIDEGVDAASFFPGDGGVDLFTEIECGVAEETWLGGSGPDNTFLRGRADGGNRLDLDFEFDTAIFSDGFESGDVSSWSTGTDATGRGGSPWDGIEYLDWPSFGDPATSGPSTVTVRGKPDFPVTIDLGPDGGTGRGNVLDSLLVDPLGLPVDDDGSQIVIDGGPPITYRGVDVVRIADPPPPTAAEDGPDGAPTLTASPNPSARGTRLRLDGAVAADVRVVVLDALGRRVAVLHDGPARAGHEWTLPAGRLAPGVYVVLAHGAGWVAARTVAVAE